MKVVLTEPGDEETASERFLDPFKRIGDGEQTD
jgi:hypothetical protein